MQLPILIGITIYLRVVSGHAPYVAVDCVDNCVVKDREIKGGEGDTFTLKYVINIDKFVTFNLKYDSTHIIEVAGRPKRIYVITSHPPFLDMNNIALTKKKKGYSFSFNVTNLNITMQDKTFSYDLSFGARDEKNKWTLNVLYRPKIIGKWNTSYDVRENDAIDFNVTLSGKPKPKVTGSITNGKVKINALSGASPYLYNVKVEGLGRSQCGKDLSLKAVGYKGMITRNVKVNVIFDPSAPKMPSVSYSNNKHCVQVNWNKIESGVCPVKYTLRYTYSNGTNTIRITTKENHYEHCFVNVNSTLSGTVSVQADVSGRKGPFSPPTDVVFGTKSSIDAVKRHFSQPEREVSKTTKNDNTYTTILAQYQRTSPVEDWAAITDDQENKVEDIKLTGYKTSLPKPVNKNEVKNESDDEEGTARYSGLYTFIIIINTVALILIIVIVALSLLRAHKRNIFGMRDEGNSETENFTQRNSVIKELQEKVQEKQQDQQQQQQQHHHHQQQQPVQQHVTYIPHSAQAQPTVNGYVTTNHEPVQEMEYATLGPGGRIGEKPIVEPSLYAQVNVNAETAFYPPLESSDEQTAEYSRPRSAVNPLIRCDIEEPIYDLAG